MHRPARHSPAATAILIALFGTSATIHASAADAPVTASVAANQDSGKGEETQRAAEQRLDLRTPAIGDVMSPAQIEEVLRRTMEPRDIEEVEVGRTRVYDPETEHYIPPGFASLFWAAGQPSGLWRLFTPRLATRSRDNIHSMHGSQPAPGIPAMSGEPHAYDK